MNIRQLSCFVAIVDEGSFTRAARAIGIAQPSLSQHIRVLEEELNGRLIERLPRGIALTPAGRALLPEARAAVRAVERGGRGARPRARAPRSDYRPSRQRKGIARRSTDRNSQQLSTFKSQVSTLRSRHIET